jgi:K+-transporting ATPase KdpF subunit
VSEREPRCWHARAWLKVLATMNTVFLIAAVLALLLLVYLFIALLRPEWF